MEEMNIHNVEASSGNV